MLLFSHRGNVNGSNPKLENKPSYITTAIDLGFFVEVDVWYHKGWWLGHDEPQYKVPNRNLLYCNHCICHAKNVEALKRMLEMPIYHCFWHQNDDYTLTSLGYIWVYPGKKLVPGSICVMPEKRFNGDISLCSGICSDYILDYETKY